MNERYSQYQHLNSCLWWFLENNSFMLNQFIYLETINNCMELLAHEYQTVKFFKVRLLAITLIEKWFVSYLFYLGFQPVL